MCPIRFRKQAINVDQRTSPYRHQLIGSGTLLYFFAAKQCGGSLSVPDTEKNTLHCDPDKSGRVGSSSGFSGERIWVSRLKLKIWGYGSISVGGLSATRRSLDKMFETLLCIKSYKRAGKKHFKHFSKQVRRALPCTNTTYDTRPTPSSEWKPSWESYAAHVVALMWAQSWDLWQIPLIWNGCSKLQQAWRRRISTVKPSACVVEEIQPVGGNSVLSLILGQSNHTFFFLWCSSDSTGGSIHEDFMSHFPLKLKLDLSPYSFGLGPCLVSPK